MATKKIEETVATVDAAAMIAELKAEIEALKAKTEEKPAERDEAALAEHLAYMDELVEVQLFKDNNKYKDDVFVSVNGENVVIKRGEKVKIKRKFAEVLENQNRQDYAAAKLIEKASQISKIADL